MVRVLSCYHFRGQKIGRCDEAAAVTVAGQSIVVGIEDNVNVYSAAHSFLSSDAVDVPFDIGSSGTHHQHISEIGVPIIFGHADKSPLSPGDEKRLDNDQQRSGSCSSSVSSIESDTEIRLSHSFSTVDLVRSLSYNRKGNYLLCLECRDGDGDTSKCSSIRVYFNWDKKSDGQPMRTRIAGVSPSSNDLEKPVLTMVEIPLTSPAIAVASCTLTGHLASLSAESIVNIFSFRIKDASGRGKMQYQDFDRLYAIEIPGFAPESLSFLGNFVACSGPGKVHVFRIQKSDKSWSPSVITTEKYGMAKTKGRLSSGGVDSSKFGDAAGMNKSNLYFDHSSKMTFDPNDDSITVNLPSVTRANRKRAGNTVVLEEYGSEILSNKSRIIFSSPVAGISVEDILRLSLPPTNSGNNLTTQEKITGTGLYPLRLKDKLGGVACAVGLTKEAMLFHLPTKEKNNPVRVANYSFTAPLVAFTFDSLFFHALTESGLETYTSRNLYYALKDHEGFLRYCNACPLKSERPCLVGIRPFVRVRFMAANESLICLLACPTPVESGAQQSTCTPPLSPSNPLLQDERLWTVYSLELPDIDMLYEDTMRLAKNQENHPDTYVTLLCELFLILKAYINAVPEDTLYYTPRYRNLCKAIGLEHLKVAWLLSSESKESGSSGAISQVSASQNPLLMCTSTEELLELAVTYLCMAKLDIQQVFSSENSAFTQEPQYIAGTVKLIDVLLSSYEQDATDKHNFSPALSSSIVDFLARHSPETLVDLVIKIPFLRENHSTRLLEILQDFVSVRSYAGKEAVALILTFIAAGGVESNVRSQVQDILSKVKSQELEPCLRLEFILERNVKHSILTDVAICLTAVNSDLPTSVISEAVKNQEVSIAEVMLAFAKAVNLNSESQIQRSLARALRTVLESYFSSKISNNNINEFSQNLSNFDANTQNVLFTDDERHAVQALVRSYISDITLSPTNKLIRSATAESSFSAENLQAVDNVETSGVDPENSNIDSTKHTESGSFTPETVNGTEIMSRNQIFRKIPSFVNFLLSVDMPGGSVTPANTTFSPTMFQNQESMESYIRLLSLLTSPCGKVEGVKDSVLSFVYNNSSSVKSTPLQLILLMFCEPVETAVSILISRQPTTVLLYAKEMFGKSTSKWKILVTQLKKRINLNPNTTDSDMFSTIIESVYLHLANTLSLTELEEVLEKGTDDVAKFRSTCKRVELANSYASMVIQISTDYLQNKQ